MNIEIERRLVSKVRAIPNTECLANHRLNQFKTTTKNVMRTQYNPDLNVANNNNNENRKNVIRKENVQKWRNNKKQQKSEVTETKNAVAKVIGICHLKKIEYLRKKIKRMNEKSDKRAKSMKWHMIGIA